MITTIVKTWLNFYLKIGSWQTLKNSKTSLNVLQVLHRHYDKLTKLESKEDRKNTGLTKCLRFSWWGAWLNNKTCKKVIAPKRWFGFKNKDLNTQDLLPSA